MTRRRGSTIGPSILAALIVAGCAGTTPQPVNVKTATPMPAESAPSVGPRRVTPSAPKREETRAGAPVPSVPPARQAPSVAETPVPSALRGVSVPTWHVGDQWAFRWESSQGQGEYVWTVDRIEVLDGAPHYVIKVGPREIYYRVRDLATALETEDGQAQIRHVPPRLGFSWPLTPGTMWRQTLTEEKTPQPLTRTIAWQVESEERIRVDAGTFDTLRIVAWHDSYRSPAVMYEMWYAPKVKQWVRLKEHFPTGIRYREMTEFIVN